MPRRETTGEAFAWAGTGDMRGLRRSSPGDEANREARQMAPGRRLVAAGILVLLVPALLGLWHLRAPLFRVHHAPEIFEARAGAFSANITGERSWRTEGLSWRLDGGPPQPLAVWPPRVPWPQFVVEIPATMLLPGDHVLVVEATAPLRPPQIWEHRFRYEPRHPSGPVVRSWQPAEPLDVQDGHFQRIRRGDGSFWVRPVPGREGWDRTLVVTGAFVGARRVETRLIFRYPTVDHGRFGFGMFPLWGGRPDVGHRPARGWRFAILWYWGDLPGLQLGFSERVGDAPPVDGPRSWPFLFEPGRIYRLIAEVWPAADGRWRLRARVHPEDEPASVGWFVAEDDNGLFAADEPLGVALFAHRSQVEFGETRVTPLAPPWPADPQAPWPNG